HRDHRRHRARGADRGRGITPAPAAQAVASRAPSLVAGRHLARAQRFHRGGVKILIVDDHHLIREGMRSVLERLPPPGSEEPVEILEADNFEAATAAVAKHPDLDLVLLDVRMPGTSGVAGLAQWQKRFPGLPVVMMSGEDDPGLVRSAIDQGALGY